MSNDQPNTHYLIVTGDVEIGPGQFERGIVSSTGHKSYDDAKAEWDWYVKEGIYEEPYETFEIRENAPTLSEVL
jgi:hypothetical protein